MPPTNQDTLADHLNIALARHNLDHHDVDDGEFQKALDDVAWHVVHSDCKPEEAAKIVADRIYTEWLSRLGAEEDRRIDRGEWA